MTTYLVASVSGRPADKPTEHAVIPNTIPRPWPLVGRDREINAVLDGIAVAGSPGVLVQGPEGAGKSRLGMECLGRLRRRGQTVASVTANPGDRDIPHSTLAPLLVPRDNRTPPAAGARPTGTTALLPSLRRSPGRQPAVLLVDDLHLADDASRALLRTLTESGEIRLIATATEGPSSSVRDDSEVAVALRVVRVPPLDGAAVARFLEEGFSGIFEDRSVRSVHEASGGLPFYMVELVTHAVASGALGREGGIWRLSRDLAPPARLVSRVVRRLSRLPAGERAVLEDLALGGPDVPESFPSDVVVGLTAAGLIDTKHKLLSIADPMIALVLTVTTPLHRARRLLLSRAERAERNTADSGLPQEHPLAATLWRLRAEDDVTPARLLGAIAQARAAADFSAAHTLAQALVRRRPDSVSHLLLGEFSFECGEHSEADAALDTAMASAESEEVRLRSLVLRTANLAQGAMRVDDAFAVNTEFRTSATSIEARNALDANEAALWCFAGHVRRARTLIESLDQRRTDTLTQIMTSSPREYVDLEGGRTPQPQVWAQEERSPRAGLLIEGEYLTPQVILDGTRARALAEAGDFTAAMELARSAYDRASAAKARTVQCWPATHLAWICWLRGDMRGARSWFGTIVALSKERSFLSGLWSGLCGRAMVCAVTGEVSAGSDALAAAATLEPRQWWRPEVHTVQGWQLAAEGQLTRARAELVQGAAAAYAAGLEVTRSNLLFDVVRLGGVHDVIDDLRNALPGTDNAFISLRLRAAEALFDRDATALEECATHLCDMGALLLAAEVWTWAATELTTRGEQQRAERIATRVEDLVQQCGGHVRTPSLIPPHVQSALTGRELEIALLAARGLANADIAESLAISPRTAGNHLHRVYAKLGISDRRQLGAVLRPGARPAV
ncbi:helix-turn-helix transcriptional regulator [Streptomyces globisporus]|uniref:helix-turn-helix transcriptional regulator n=1 Tax=Streptomyces globisporus TaxID=1908 RepID=UPI003806E140